MGATVALTSNETHAERHVTTNSQGIFQITGILPGQYSLSVTASGFPQLIHALRLEVGQQLDLNVERMKFQFRAEFFNALNKVNLGTPDRFVNTPQFGTITEAATPGRQIQLSARLSF